MTTDIANYIFYSIIMLVSLVFMVIFFAINDYNRKKYNTQDTEHPFAFAMSILLFFFGFGSIAYYLGYFGINISF